MNRAYPLSIAVSLPLLLQPVSGLAVTFGQVDTFESGTTEGWAAGGGPFGQVPPVPPTNQPSGGPAGSGDNFLQITSSGGDGPGSRLTAFNMSQWAGDYSAAGVTAITMHLANFGTTDLSIRLYLANPAGGPPTAEAVSDAVFLPGGSGWVHAAFALDASSLTSLAGDVNALLGNVTELRIFHGVVADFPGESAAGQLGVDNIAAVPLPAGLPLFAAGLAALGVAGRRCPSPRKR